MSKKNTPKRMLLVALLLALTACRPVADDAPDAKPADGGTVATTAVMPAIDKPAAIGDAVKLRVDTLDGKGFDLARHRGRWVLVNYWATWCGPCLEEMPELSALDAMREHIQVIGLAYEEIEPDEMRAFLGKHPVVYPIAIVDVTAPPAVFEVPRGLPVSHLIGPDGKLVKSFLGPVTASQIEAVIAENGGPELRE